VNNSQTTTAVPAAPSVAGSVAQIAARLRAHGTGGHEFAAATGMIDGLVADETRSTVWRITRIRMVLRALTQVTEVPR